MSAKTTTLRAFHGSQEIKDKYVARVRAHMLADQIVQGEGWNEHAGKGCCVGCTLERYDHAQYEVELGIPQVIARLFDAIHEGLPTGEFQKWPLLSLECIPVGADLNNVWSRFAGWIINKEVRQWVGEEFKDVHAALDQVTALYARLAAGETVTEEEWQNAADAAYAAYAAAAADAYAADAADAAAAYAAYADAGSESWMRMRDKLVELLSAAPVLEVA